MKTILVWFTLLTAILLVAPVKPQAQEGDAKAILKTMSDYVGRQQTIQLTTVSRRAVVFTITCLGDGL